MTTSWELRLGDQGYPECLASSPRPPRMLFGIGDPSLLVPGLGVIGARKATPYGTSCARLFAGWAAAAGAVVVSGAAIGCDQAAHRAALESGGKTVAVLGCGADVDYPSGARCLLDRLRRECAVVSEVPWGRQPTRWTFPERNRIIAALSAAVLVVEAGLPSGTFSTADAALDAGREVLAVPGSVFAPECRGPNRLIRQGATPITDVSELAESLRALGLAGTAEDADPMSPSAPPPNDRLLRALLADPMRPDDVVRELGIDVVEAIRRISALEASGFVRRYSDGRYGPCDGRH